MRKRPNCTKREEILSVAKRLFIKKGYEDTSVRDIVKEANTSMGNLYFHFPNKLNILTIVCREFIRVLRNKIYKVHAMGLSPEVGFALAFRIGYITTLEDPKLSKFWLEVRNISDIHNFSLENKKIRLNTFFGDRISDAQLTYLAAAMQGIADSIYELKQSGELYGDSTVFSNMIIDFCLRLLGFSEDRIKSVIQEVECYIRREHITVDKYFKY